MSIKSNFLGWEPGSYCLGDLLCVSFIKLLVRIWLDPIKSQS